MTISAKWSIWPKWIRWDVRLWPKFTKHFFSIFISEVTLVRGCCNIKASSPVCPPGDDLQTVDNEVYYLYLTRLVLRFF